MTVNGMGLVKLSAARRSNENSNRNSVEEWLDGFGARNVANGVLDVQGDTLRVGFDDVESGGGTIWKKTYQFEQVIFNHDFAKALAGTKWICFECGNPYDLAKTICTVCMCGAYNEAWEVFLTEIARSTDRQKYLDDYVKTINPSKGADE